MDKKLTLPNLLSILRIILIPIFIVLYLNEAFYYDGFPLFAMLIFLLAVSTDILDGLIARGMNLTSNLGKVLDPLADKLLRLSLVCCFWIKGVLPLYLFIILLSIDFFVISISAILFFNKIVVKSNIFGKISTIFMCVSLFVCFFHNIVSPIDSILILLAVLIVIITLVQYFFIYLKLIKKIN